MNTKPNFLLWAIVFLLSPTIGLSQFTPRMTPAGTGYLEYLPPDYATNSTKKYPLMMFLHGAGEKGSGSPSDLEKVKAHGPPKEIQNGHNMCFTVDGVEKCFIVIAPQLPGDKPSWGVSLIDEVFRYILNGSLNYRVDLNQIHLTGLSLGSNGVYKYSYMSVNDPNKLASISPIAAWADTNKGCVISEREIPLWAFHGDQDKTVGYASGLAMFNSVKDCTTPVPTAELIFTTYEGIGHNSWTRAYNTGHTYHNPNLYEWMLSKSLSGNPTANAGPDQSITLPTNSITISGSGSDPDGTITSYQWKRISGPSASLANNNTATLTANNLLEGIYTFRLTVTDNSGNTATDDVNVTVNPAAVNVSPTVNIDADITLILPTSSTNITGTASDADGNIVTYAWTQQSGPSTATTTGAASATITVSNLIEGTYKFRITVTDDDGATAFDEVNVIVNPATINSPPTANAGSDKTINLPTNSTTLTGSGSDSDGSIVSYAWAQLSGPTVTLANQNTTTLGLSDLIEGSYEFKITITDDDGATGSDNVLVTVIAANQNPNANAGADINLTLPTNATNLSGSATDADGTVTAYLWQQISGPAASTMVNASTATASISNLVEGTYEFQLTVTDDDGAEDTDIVQVTVISLPPNIAPVANAGSDKNITLPVNSVMLNGSGSDSDGTIASYSWTKTSGPSTFSLSGQNTATLTANNLVAGTYIFRLTVTDDDGATHFDEATVSVAPETVNQSPVADAGTNISITLPTNSVVINGSGTDADGTIASYGWTQVSGPSTATLSGETTADLSANNLIEGVYTFQLTVTDDQGASGSDNVNVTITALNTPPVVNTGADVNLVLPTDNVDITGTATDNDGTIASTQWTQISGPAASFTVSGNIISITGLTAGTYIFRFSATDNDGDSAQDDVEIVVTASNVLPTVNAGPDKNVTLPTNSINLTGTASDSDGSIVSYSWSIISGPIATLANQNTTTVTVSDLTEGSFTLRFTATDNDGGSKSDQAIITVNPAATNQVPTAEAGSNLSITLPTNFVTISGSGSDTDGSIASYNWTKKSGPSAGTLSNNTTPTLTVSGLIEGTYVFTLMVTDDDGATDMDDVTVTVNPEAVNQSPTSKAGSDITLVLPTNSTNIVGAGSDPDGTIVSYSWSQASGPTAATLSGASNPTVTVNDLVEGTYTFSLTVQDDDGASDDDYVNVIVQPETVNQKPTANAGLDKTLVLPTNTINIVGSGSDVDGSITNYLWTRISGPAADLTNTSTPTMTASNLLEGQYKFRLTVTDDDGDTGSDEVIITVQPTTVNQSPLASAGADFTLVLPTNSAIIYGSGSDPDGTVLTYNWSQLSGPSATLTNQNTPQLTVTDMLEGVYIFRLIVTDEDGAQDSDDVQITILPLNTNLAPTAFAGADQVIKLPTNTAVLNGSGNDVDGTIVSYLWEKVSGPNGTSSDQTQATLNLSDLLEGIYIFSLTVTDDDGAQGADEVQISILPSSFNLTPVANAGEDLFLELPTSSIVINGSGQDPDGIIDTYHWFMASGSNTPSLSGENTSDLSISGLIEGVYIFTLEVTDDGGLADSDDVKVVVTSPDVNENQPPLVDAGRDQIIILPENNALLTGKMITPGLIESYAWTQIAGATAQLSGVDSDSLVVTGLDEGDYTFELTITNNQGLSGSDRVNIEVISQFTDLQFPMKMFSPNRDGENDTWILDPDLSKYENCHLYIYNRRGSQVYESISYQNNWEAQLNGQELPDGVYFYILKCDNKTSSSGSITVIR
ncbi:tandem-95 repeat protein [Fulvivirga sp. 29W222]|uniref:Tandem-95 repeat protein n=1 Tax=Fulvivirga marina TaxID=2494733 RepID=A0A937KG14_9BACT|nr:tandem-95 repeat protein [Fulvivirga marina]MBL6448895.1 tandem-95 repeat protein [Fulvivirga marina]